MRQLLAVLLVSACFTPLAASKPISDTGEVERLFGMTAGEQGIEIQVYSGGCTNKDYFRVDRFESLGSPEQIQLLFVRVRPDLCRAYLPYGTRIKYTYGELGLEDGTRFTVLNPLATMNVVTR